MFFFKPSVCDLLRSVTEPLSGRGPGNFSYQPETNPLISFTAIPGKLLCSAAAAVLLLAGCSSKPSEIKETGMYGSPEAGKVYNLSLYGNIVPSGKKDGMLVADGYVSYTDLAGDNEPVILCTQPGCLHNDETCDAWIGNASYFIADHDIWYYMICDTDHHWAELHSYNYQNKERKLTARWECGSDTFLSTDWMYRDHEKIYVSIFQSTVRPDGQIEETHFTDCISLLNGTKETVPGSEREGFRFFCAWNNALIYELSGMREVPEDYDTWISSGKTDEEYDAYLQTLMKNELHMRKENEDILLASDYSLSANGAYGKWLCYTEDDTVKVLDMESGETVTKQCTDIQGVHAFDGHLLMIAGEDVNGYRLLCAALPDLSDMRDISGQTFEGSIPFSVHAETENGFYGISQGSYCWIRKQDFYSGHFDKTIVLKSIS